MSWKPLSLCLMSHYGNNTCCYGPFNIQRKIFSANLIQFTSNIVSIKKRQVSYVWQDCEINFLWFFSLVLSFYFLLIARSWLWRNHVLQSEKSQWNNVLKIDYQNSCSPKIYCLSNGIDKTSWSCSWNSDQSCTLNSARVNFCLFKIGPCAVISSQISSKFSGEIVCLFCILHFECQYCQLSRILCQSEVSDTRGFGPFNRQVTITLTALF